MGRGALNCLQLAVPGIVEEVLRRAEDPGVEVLLDRAVLFRGLGGEQLEDEVRQAAVFLPAVFLLGDFLAAVFFAAPLPSASETAPVGFSKLDTSSINVRTPNPVPPFTR